jgi:outer membrane receptor protein involved in Fe transport
VDLDAEERSFEQENALGETAQSAFTGSSRTWVVDAMLKWTAAGDPRRRYLKLQGEYMDRTEDGDLSYTALAPTLSDSYRASQSGWYVQGVYQFLPRWRVGARYDSLDSGTPKIGLIESGTLGWEDFPLLAPATPSRTTLMLDWNLSEFSRLRTQYAWDDARPGPTDEQFFLQYIYALGAHGAHRF